MKYMVLATITACFTAASPAWAGSELTGAWQITAIAGFDAPDAAKTEFIVGEDGFVAMSVGCNRMRGHMQQNRFELSFGPMAATMMACPPPLDKIERGVQSALGAATSLKIDPSGQSALIFDKNGAVVFALNKAP